MKKKYERHIKAQKTLDDIEKNEQKAVKANTDRIIEEQKDKKKKPKEIDGFLKYQMWKAQNQFGAEYDGLGIKKVD